MAAPRGNKLKILHEVNTIIVVDDSGSMRPEVNNLREDRWTNLKECITYLAPHIVKYDPDGFDLYYLNRRTSDLGDVTRGKAPWGILDIKDVASIESAFNFAPNGATYFEPVMRSIFQAWKAKLETDGSAEHQNVIIVTDGEASDGEAVIEAITAIVKYLMDNNLPANVMGFQFIQIGKDENAEEYLKTLDDDLNLDLDIVDTVKMSQIGSTEGLKKALLGAIDKGFDRVKPASYNHAVEQPAVSPPVYVK